MGISAIMTNIVKVREMCVLVRKHLPKATIVIGGHIANNADLPRIINADHIVRGDGVRWFRKYLGQDENKAVRHPMAYSGFRRSDYGHHPYGFTRPKSRNPDSICGLSRGL